MDIMIPAYFIAHGSPSIVIEDNEYTRFLVKLGKKISRPKAIVIFSAHFESEVQKISAVESYTMIYDFYGFPKEMYNIEYPVKGNPKLAEEIHNLFEVSGIKSEIDRSRGIDHGAWTILKLMYPNADIPVITLSVNPHLSPDMQFKIGEAISTLREKDILILGSGGIVHNLAALKWDMEGVEPWANEFDNWVNKNIENWDLNTLFDFANKGPYAKRAVPTNEHFVPLFIAMGASGQAGRGILLQSNFQYGNLGLSCFEFK
jgi:4,5-DOPA dioxygenase extradiol